MRLENIKFTQIVRYLYIAMGAFNATLALIVMSQIFGFYVPDAIREFLIASLKLFIPVVLLDGLSDLIEIQIEAFKDLIKRLINWSNDNPTIPLDPKGGDIKIDKTPKIDGVHVDDLNIPSQNPSNPVEPEVRKHLSDRFGFEEDFKENSKRSSVNEPDSVDFEIKGRKLGDPLYHGRVSDAKDFKYYNDFYDGNSEEYEDNSIDWGLVFAATIITLSVSYYLFPDFYHNIYYGLKDKFFPGDRGGGGGSEANPNIKINTAGRSIEILDSNIERIINDEKLTNLEKSIRLGYLQSAALSVENNLSPHEVADRANIFAKAHSRLDYGELNTGVQITSSSNISKSDVLTPSSGLGDIILTNESSPASPLTPSDTLTPANLGSLTPTSSVTPISVSPPVNTGSLSPAGSVTPTPGTPTSSLIQHPIRLTSTGGGLLKEAISEVLLNKNTSVVEKQAELMYLHNLTMAPGSNSNPQDIVKYSNMLTNASKFVDSKAQVGNPSILNIPSTVIDLSKLDHSPIKENLPDSIDWAKGGKLKGIFSSPKGPPVLNLPVDLDIPEGHISNLPSGITTPADFTVSSIRGSSMSPPSSSTAGSLTPTSSSMVTKVDTDKLERMLTDLKKK
jgi:hypothetical protein